MRIRLDETAAAPWANGGGVTRELAVQRTEHQLAWRISVAEIGRDGPFSRFPGLARVHTIIDGAGLNLQGSTDIYKARPFKPLYFDGALPLNARLLGGPCRAFNVIYDPRVTTASVDVHIGAQPFDVAPFGFVFVAKGMAATSVGAQLIAGEAEWPDDALTVTPAPDAIVLSVRFAQVSA